MANKFVHGVELQTSDPKKAKEFYNKLFGWEFQEIPQMNYARFAAPCAEGGVMQNPVAGASGQWAPYFLVDDVPAAVKRAKELGAKIVVDASEIAGHGWFAMITDPTGATFGLWKSAA